MFIYVDDYATAAEATRQTPGKISQVIFTGNSVHTAGTSQQYWIAHAAEVATGVVELRLLSKERDKTDHHFSRKPKASFS